jgi:Carboxypeptidase regulatory-like domain/TonB dependent receptor
VTLGQPSNKPFFFYRRNAFTLLVRNLCMIVFALNAYSSAQIFTGAVGGQVLDPQGAVIQQATVTVKNLGTDITRSLDTSADGSFRVDGLEAGTYEVAVSAKSFAESRSRIAVRVGQVSSMRIQLTVGETRASVEVQENALDRTSSVLGNPVTGRQILESPLANRSFANIAYIAPMTAPVEPSDPTKARITAVSFAGSSGLNVDLSVDGGDNNDDFIGGFLQNISPEAIREFNVRTAQFDADTSRTNGGSIILSTQSGTNQWHGSGTGFFRASALNARNTLDNPEPNPKQPYASQNYVGTIGGPLKKDSLWLFTSYEYNHEDPSVAYSASNQNEFKAMAQLAASGLIPGGSSISIPSSVTVPFRDSLLNSRVDWRQSQRSDWFLRFSLDRNLTNNDLVQQGSAPNTGFATHSNYYNLLLSNHFVMGSEWLGSLVVESSLFNHHKLRNSNLGFALAFPFTTTTITTSGFETYGDNQFISPLAAFPIERDQEKYQFRYDMSHSGAGHATKFGINFIHEPVLRGRFADSAEQLFQYNNNPSYYIANNVDPGTDVTPTPVDATDGAFSQNIQRLGFYAEDSWHVVPHLTLNYGLRYDTTFGLFTASGRDQNQNLTLQALRAAGVPFANGVPHDYRKAFSPRLGIAYSPGDGNTVVRAGAGLFYNDLGQNGWAEAFQAVNNAVTDPTLQGTLPPSVIDPHYHTPYAIQASAAIEHAFANNWRVTIQAEHQGGVHQYRRYEYLSGISLPSSAPDASVFRTDNRSSYNGASFILQHRGGRYDVTAHYTFARATTWGAQVGELFDYVNGVTDPLHPFGPGDHGPSGEDMRHRFVVSGIFELPYKFQISTLAQFESARPFTMVTPADANNDGNFTDRAVVNGVPTSLDEFRGSPYSQIDVRVSRDFRINERVSIRPFAEMFNLLNRSNPGNNYIPDISALPVPVNDLNNATALCPTSACAQPIHSLNDLRVPAGALGDFFGPGTTTGIPFAAQLGVRVNF